MMQILLIYSKNIDVVLYDYPNKIRMALLHPKDYIMNYSPLFIIIKNLIIIRFFQKICFLITASILKNTYFRYKNNQN